MNTINRVNEIFDRAEAAVDQMNARMTAAHDKWMEEFAEIVVTLGGPTAALCQKAFDKGWMPLQIDGDGTVWFCMDKARATVKDGKWTLVRGK